MAEKKLKKADRSKILVVFLFLVSYNKDTKSDKTNISWWLLMFFSSFPAVVALDFDGFVVKSEELASTAYFLGAMEYFSDKPLVQAIVEQKLNPENNGADWFAKNIMGLSHAKILECINTQFAFDNHLNINQFQNDFLKPIDDKIASMLTPESLFPDMLELIKYLHNLHQKREIDFYIISGSSKERLQKSFKNVGIDVYIDFATQVISGGTYNGKDEVLAKLSHNNPDAIMYAGDGYGDARACRSPVGGNPIFFIGKSEGKHCVGEHKKNLQELIVYGEMTTTSRAVFNLIKEWLAEKKAQDANFLKLAQIYNARASFQHIT